MAILSKACRQNNFESHNSLKLALRMFEAFVRILLIANLSLNKTLLTFLLCVRQTWMTQFWQFLRERLSSFNLKGFRYSYAWSCSLW